MRSVQLGQFSQDCHELVQVRGRGSNSINPRHEFTNSVALARSVPCTCIGWRIKSHIWIRPAAIITSQVHCGSWAMMSLSCSVQDIIVLYSGENTGKKQLHWTICSIIQFCFIDHSSTRSSRRIVDVLVRSPYRILEQKLYNLMPWLTLWIQ